jgi:thiamine biosynthesis protein ThiI
MAKRGMTLDAIHFQSFPYTSAKALEKTVDIAKIIARYAGDMTMFIVSFTEIQEAIHKECPAEFMITIMRRIMMRIAERTAIANGCGSLITGESLAQVASQTQESITVTNKVIENLPVFRPLIGMDKDEIIKTAREINTFELSILPYEDCCTVFLPKNPVIKPKLEVIEKAESRLDVEALIASALEKTEVIKIEQEF